MKLLNLKKAYAIDDTDLKLELDLSDRAQRRVVSDDDRFDNRFFADQLKPEDTVWDIGANVGWTSFTAAMNARQVIAFEPNPVAYATLTTNIKRNGVNSIQTSEIAVSDTNGTMTLYSANQESTAISSFASDERMTEETCVRTATVDSLREDYPAPSLIKVDVEGAEMRVLEGATKTLESGDVDWFIEVHGLETGRRDRLGLQGDSVQDVFDILSDNGYHIYGVQPTEDRVEYKYLTEIEDAPLHWFATTESP